MTNDSVLVAKVIYNGYINYYNWSYPTNTSNELVARSNASNPFESLEITSTIWSKCPNNTSCVLLIGVMGNSATNITTSSYTLSLLNNLRRLDQSTKVDALIPTAKSQESYWLFFNNTGNWKQTFNLIVNSYNTIANLYVNVNKLFLGDDFEADYYSENLGPDYFWVTNTDQTTKQFRYLPKVLMLVSIKTFTASTSVSLIIKGPT